MEKKINKVVLAYSGGLDTSAMLLWLKETYDCEVVCYTADVGQGDELTGLEEKAKATARQSSTSRTCVRNSSRILCGQR